VLSSALTNVDRCEDEPALARALNADAAEVIASSCLDLGTQLVYVSTEYVFDGKDGPYGELAPPHPVSAYGKTKLDGERLVLQTSRENLVVRTTVVYSWDVTGKNFVMQVINGLRAGRVLRIPNDQRSSPTYAPDLASAIGDLCMRKAEGIVNVVGPEVLDRFSFAKLIADVFGLGAQALEPVATRLLGQKAQRPLNAGLRDGRMVSILGRPLRGPLDGLGDLRRIAEAAA
jgi:dTDP-4-dehydrorhamnose reductase